MFYFHFNGSLSVHDNTIDAFDIHPRYEQEFKHNDLNYYNK